MPLPQEILEEMQVRRRDEAMRANRDRRIALAASAALCLGWCALGCALILIGVHSSSHVWGRVAFWGGLGVGNGGILFTLVDTYRRGERRGDW